MAFPCPLPADALLARYADPSGGAYTDCYGLDVPGSVPLADFIEAFYSSPVFWLERSMIGLVFGKRATDAGARKLALGEIDKLSAWTVEARASDQLLMKEIISGKTRSWFQVAPLSGGTRLYFGTAVLPVGVKADGTPRMSALYVLVGFHKIYARVLLHGAAVRLKARA